MNLLELFGAVNPLSGQSVPAQRGMADYLARTARGAAGIGERAFEASEERRAGGDYDAGPGIEAALTAMTGTAFGAPAGAMGAGPTRLTRVSDEVKPTARPGVTRRHLVYDAETPDGTIRSSATINGNTAHVQNIEALGPDGAALPVDQARGRFGTTTLRDLFTAFRSEHPEVNRIVGDRISGARLGGGYEPEAGVPFEMTLPSGPVPPPAPPAAPREPGLAGFFRERGAGPAAPAAPPGGAPAGLDFATLQSLAADLSAKQGGFGTVNIHDLIAASGLPRDVVHQALLREAKAGNVGLHGTSRAYADYPAAEQASWLNVPSVDGPLVTFTVKSREPQTWDELQALFDSTRGP